ncbi:ACT domain-containing protein, partial [Isoptericola croceus]|uniref:ACT domain-containing protein n=1 Tax=Isoptericola croceus TaxID=3031406 RepID=UPI0023F978FD
DRPGTSLEVFSRIAGENITVDMIVQNIGEEGLADISFTVLKDDLEPTLAVVAESVEKIGAKGFNYDDRVAKISVVGLGMAHQTG